MLYQDKGALLKNLTLAPGIIRFSREPTHCRRALATTVYQDKKVLLTKRTETMEFGSFESFLKSSFFKFDLNISWKLRRAQIQNFF